MTFFGLGKSKEIFKSRVLCHYSSIYKAAYRYCGSREEAEDLTQSAFVSAYEHFYQLKETKNARAWLFKILRNKFLMGKRKKEDLVLDEPDKGHKDLEALVDRWAPENNIEDQRNKGILEEAMDSLPELYKTPLLLTQIQEFSYEETAAILDIPVGTVMSRISRAKNHLKKALLQRLDEKKSNLSVLRRKTR